jgi:hypothetical protein
LSSPTPMRSPLRRNLVTRLVEGESQMYLKVEKIDGIEEGPLDVVTITVAGLIRTWRRRDFDLVEVLVFQRRK